MEQGTISLRYAKALFKYAEVHNQVEQSYQSALKLGNAFSVYPALKRVMDNRLLTSEHKREVIEECSGGSKVVNKCFSDFIALVIAQHREEFLRTICLSYADLVRQSRNIIDINITTAAEIDTHTLEKFKTWMEKTTGKQARINATVATSLIGGYVICWDTYRIDTSIKRRLENIGKSLINYDKQY